jgi:hypothetical protein
MGLSNAERQARWRERQKAAAQGTEALKAEIKTLRAEIAALKRAKTAPADLPEAYTDPESGPTRRMPKKLPSREEARLGRLQADVTRLRAMLAEDKDVAKLRARIVEQNTELHNQRIRIRRLTKERDQYEKAEYAFRKLRGRTELTPKQHANLLMCLHPDQRGNRSKDDLLTAYEIVATLKPLFIP